VGEVIREFFESIEVIEKQHFMRAILCNISLLCEIIDVVINAGRWDIDIVYVAGIKVTKKTMQMLRRRERSKMLKLS